MNAWRRGHDASQRSSWCECSGLLTRPPNKTVTAALFKTLYGHELRVFYNQDESDIISTSLSRTGDGPLEHEASEIRAVLETVGWLQS